jgi:hypothetical protein
VAAIVAVAWGPHRLVRDRHASDGPPEWR